jgi:hypothetical protein
MKRKKIHLKIEKADMYKNLELTFVIIQFFYHCCSYFVL